jgi:hypothetical protein
VQQAAQRQQEFESSAVGRAVCFTGAKKTSTFSFPSYLATHGSKDRACYARCTYVWGLTHWIMPIFVSCDLHGLHFHFMLLTVQAYTAVKDVKNPQKGPQGHGARAGGGVDSRDWMN